MRIQNMFQDDIDRKINGVVKVDQNAADVLAQEVKEYVITRDIRRHEMYCIRQFTHNAANISGKDPQGKIFI